MLLIDAVAAAAFALFLALIAALVYSRRRRGPVISGRYELVARVGEGGMGTVYRAWDRTARRTVAIKRLRPELQGDERQRERFLIEACLLSALRHPNIVQFFGAVGDERSVHLVFEFIAGRTLHAQLNAAPGRRLTPARALAILSAAAAAVDYAHALGVIHRDLKPANIMIGDAGGVKITDFGVASRMESWRHGSADVIVGTPAYMAPEQARGETGVSADLYALGACFYEMLTGALPFDGDDALADKLAGRLRPPSALAHDLPPALDAVVTRALAARREDRFPSGAEFAHAAARALAPAAAAAAA
jgi:serine/threonine protein kinase